jgi:hypothetical protein
MIARAACQQWALRVKAAYRSFFRGQDKASWLATRGTDDLNPGNWIVLEVLINLPEIRTYEVADPIIEANVDVDKMSSIAGRVVPVIRR